MNWITSDQISLWGKGTQAKSTLSLLIARLIRASTPLSTFIELPSGTDTYSGGWDGIVKSEFATAFVPIGISLWEMGTETAIKRKADGDYKKRTLDPLGFRPSDCVFVFVTPHKWSQKQKWVKTKKAEGVCKDVVVYDAVNLEQWLSDTPAVGWWFSVFSGNMPSDGLLSAEQSWKEYAESPAWKLSPLVLTCSRKSETETLHKFLNGGAGVLCIRARSRDEAVAFIIATGLSLEIQQRENFLSKSLVVDNPGSFRMLAANRSKLILITRFEEIQAVNAALANEHHVLVAQGADDTYSAGKPLSLSQPGRELEDALKASGLSDENARKYMVESGHDLTILRRLLEFPHNKIKWADPQFSTFLLPALFLGRWDESKKGDVAIIESLSNEPYSSYIEKLNRWRNDSNPFVYQIGSMWRLASPLDAWTLLADSITSHQLGRFEETVISVLGQVKPMFDLEPGKRFMASLYGKESIYSKWAREGAGQSLILFALFGSVLKLPIGNSQQWVDRVVNRLLESKEPNLWPSLNDVMPLLAEAAPDRFLSSVYTALFDSPEIVMDMFQEDPSPVTPRSYHTGLLWALEALSWFEPYLERTTRILAKLAIEDPGGATSNRPINSLRSIYLAWHPQTYTSRFERNEILSGLVKTYPDVAWKLLAMLLPEYHGNAIPTFKTRWRDYGVEDINHQITWPEIWETNTMNIDLSIPLAGIDEQRLAVLVKQADNMSAKDRNNLFAHMMAIAGKITQKDFSIPAALRAELHHHRQFPDQTWALPESELAGYDNLLNALTPTSTIDKFQFLFDESHPTFPEMIGLDPLDYEAEEKMIQDKRIEAIMTIYTEFGIDKLIELAQTVREKRIFGLSMAFCISDKNEQLKILFNCGLGSEDNFSSAAGFTWQIGVLKGLYWAIEVYQELENAGLGTDELAQFLNWMPPTSELYQFVEKQDDVITKEYWSKCTVWLSALEDLEKVGAVEHLLNVGRNATALQQINYYPTLFSTEIITRCLANTARNPFEATRRISSHDVERLFDELYKRNDYDYDTMGKLEWLCLPLVNFSHRHSYTRILQKELNTRPTFYVELLEILYRPKDDGGKPELLNVDNIRNAAMAMHAQFLLDEWSSIPGTEENGNINGTTLNNWVDESRLLAEQKSRLEVADSHIGKLLAKYPRSKTGEQPPSAICRVVDRINTKAIIDGFYAGIYNLQSFTSRGAFDGGDIERTKAANFKKIADDLLLDWPVTSSVFQGLANSYMYVAVRHDEEAQRDSLDF